MTPSRWKKDTLGNVAKVERGRFSIRPRNDPRYYGGSLPFVQTGDIGKNGKYITSFSQTLNEEGRKVSKVFSVNTILMTIAANIGDVSITQFDTACPDSLVGISPKDEINHEFLYYYLHFNKNNIDALATQNAQKNVNVETLKPFSLIFPERKEEQEKIAKILSTWDDAIEKLSRSITRHKILLDNLVINTLRKELKSSYVKISKIFDVYSAKGKTTQEKLSVLSVTQDKGVVLRSESGRNIKTISDDTSNYKIIRQGDYVLSLRSFEGGVEYSYLDGLISPAYTVLRAKQKIDSEFFKFYFKSKSFLLTLSPAVVGIRDGKQIDMNVFWDIKVPFPAEARIKELSKSWFTLEMKINLLMSYKENLQKQKQGLMQELLTGRKRVKV